VNKKIDMNELKEKNVAIGDRVFSMDDDGITRDVGTIVTLGLDNGNGYNTDFRTSDSDLVFSPFSERVAIIPPFSEWPVDMIIITEQDARLTVIRDCGNAGVGERFTIARTDTLERLGYSVECNESGSVNFEGNRFYEGRPGIESNSTIYYVGDIEIEFDVEVNKYQ